MALPERSVGKARRRCWFSASTVSKYVVVRSKVAWFGGHWIGSARRSIRCSGKECTICKSGAVARVFTYVFVEQEDNEILVFEIPERLFGLAQELEASATGGPGCRLSISREGSAKNSAIVAMIVGFEECEELDSEAFVRTLGLPARS